MSRRRTQVRAQAARTSSSPGATASPIPADAIAISAVQPEDPEALHRRALELREYRMGLRERPAALDVPAAAATTAPSRRATSVTLPVMGMTCRACEVRIAKYVGRLPNVERVSASAVRGSVTVECSAPVSAAAIEHAINKAGYEIGHTPWIARDGSVWATAGVGVLLVAAIAIVAAVSGIGDLANGAGDLSQGGVVVALLLGLAAGVSTCMALVGGLILGLSAAFQAGRQEAASRTAGMRPSLVFVGGRVAGYTVFGALLGAVGASVTMPPQVTAFLMVAVAVVMLLLGTRLTGLSPRIAGWAPTLPMGLGRRLGLGGANGFAYSDTRAATLGAASFFLPCGFTQAIQIFALSTGSPLYGAALLGTFALGTAPGLLALAGLPLVVPSRAKPTLLRLVGVVVIGFAVLNGSAGIRLSGFTFPSLVSVANAAPLPGTLGGDGVQRITTYQDAGGYRPSNVVIYAGYPTQWTIQSSTTATCAASIWAPDLDIRVRLSKGANTIDLPALRPGTLGYTCSMGMYSGRITVVEAPAGAAPAANAAKAPTTTTPASSTMPVASTQELRTVQDAGGYSPAVATIRAGVPTAWHIDSRSQASCAVDVVVPSLGIQKILEPGDNVIELPAMAAGTLRYTCGMGMYSGAIEIE